MISGNRSEISHFFLGGYTASYAAMIYPQVKAVVSIENNYLQLGISFSESRPIDKLRLEHLMEIVVLAVVISSLNESAFELEGFGLSGEIRFIFEIHLIKQVPRKLQPTLHLIFYKKLLKRNSALRFQKIKKLWY